MRTRWAISPIIIGTALGFAFGLAVRHGYGAGLNVLIWRTSVCAAPAGTPDPNFWHDQWRRAE